MGLAGEGAVAIWHDIAPEGREEFYAWHGREHVPERVDIPGFLCGRRYVAIEVDLELFNLYKALSVEVLKDAEASGVATAEQEARGVANAVPRRVLLLEGWGDEADFVRLAKAELTAGNLDAAGGHGPYSLGLYRHQINRTKTDWSAG